LTCRVWVTGRLEDSDGWAVAGGVRSKQNETGFFSNMMTVLRRSGLVGNHTRNFPRAEVDNPAISYWPEDSRNGKTDA
jgi:hypothetical protein